MRILSVDTSGPFAGSALMEDGIVTHEIAACHGLTHSVTSMPMTEDVLSAAGLMPSDIDLFAAVTGPGSFTGVRIGVCAVKGLAHACNKKVVAVDSLEALAMNGLYFDGLVCPILDARRSQVYCAAFDCSSGMPVRVLEDDALPLTEFLAKLPADKKCLFTGDGLKVHFPKAKEILGDRAVCAVPSDSYIRPASVCVLADRYKDSAVEPYELKPCYLRAPQAERERNRRLSEEK